MSKVMLDCGSSASLYDVIGLEKCTALSINQMKKPKQIMTLELGPFDFSLASFFDMILRLSK